MLQMTSIPGHKTGNKDSIPAFTRRTDTHTIRNFHILTKIFDLVSVSISLGRGTIWICIKLKCAVESKTPVQYGARV